VSISKDSAGREAAVALRNIEFHRPLDQEVPHELLAGGCATLDDSALRAALDPDYTRVASRIEPALMVGAYAMQRHDEQHFELLSLSVLGGFEHQLLGRRLLGHALGLAESKAGRVVTMRVCRENTRAIEILKRYGFVVSDQNAFPEKDPHVVLRFELTPE